MRNENRAEKLQSWMIKSLAFGAKTEGGPGKQRSMELVGVAPASTREDVGASRPVCKVSAGSVALSEAFKPVHGSSL